MLFSHTAILSALALSGAYAANSTSSAAASSSTTSRGPAITTTYSVASSCSFSTKTITAQSQLDSLSDCNAVGGTIKISGSIGSASIAGIKQIQGSLIVSNATSLTSLTADSLEWIQDEFGLTDLTTLSTLSFPVLTKVGSINFVTLPGLNDFQFTDGIQEADKVLISDTTVQTLDGIDVVDVETFNLNNNNYLESFDSSLQTVSNALSITSNGDGLDVSLDDLVWANNITISKCSNISFSNLQAVNGTIHINNNSIETLNFDKLTKVGETISIVGNEDLGEVVIDGVTTLSGDLVVEDNSDVDEVSLSKLKSVSGSVVVEGNFSNVTLDALKSVRGSLTIKSDEDIVCSSFNKLAKASDIEGSYLCKGASSSYSAASGSGSVKGGSSSKSTGTDSASTSKGAAANLGAIGFEHSTLIGGAIALLVSLL